jgi:hypothetical protein
MQYDPATEILRITFVSGMVYDYKNVPQHVFASLKTSGSKGTYLNRHIKNHYRYEKVK